MKKKQLKEKVARMIRGCETEEQLYVAKDYACRAIMHIYPLPRGFGGFLWDLFTLSDDYARDSMFREVKELAKARSIIINNGEA